EMARNRLDHPKECVAFLQRAIDNGLHARRVVSKIQVFSKEGGALDIQPEPVGHLMEHALEFCRAFLPPTVELKLSAKNSKLMLAVDRQAVMQVINNLVNNAAHAMDYQGEVQVRCRAVELGKERAEQLDVPPGAYGCIEVEDTGTGMSKEELAKIFDP